MFNSSRQSYRWNMILFTPTILALAVATLDSAMLGSGSVLMAWGIFSAVCCSWCAYDYCRATPNPALRYAKVFGFSLIFWFLNLGISFFGGCVCAAVGSRH